MLMAGSGAGRFEVATPEVVPCAIDSCLETTKGARTACDGALARSKPDLLCLALMMLHLSPLMAPRV